jgi:hypothetical protein
MVYWFLLPITALTAIFNRLGRGEAGVPRPVWYIGMVLLAGVLVCARLDFQGMEYMGAWLLYFLGYALMPWQAMFSAVTGEKPGRDDGWYIQWMQVLSADIVGIELGKPIFYTAETWRQFGMVYGALRATLMMPGIIALIYVSHSLVPLAGLEALLMGVVYWLCGRFSRHEGMGNAMGVPLAELTMGWWHGTYMLIVASVM